MGTAELASASLRALVRAPSLTVVAVVSQPDKPVGRKLELRPTPVKQTALAENLPVLQPLRARDEIFLADLKQLAPDLIVVAAYGQILPQAILDLPRHGCLNVHTSLLPKFRGASPIQTALLHDERTTGVTIMRMDAGLDTGPILTQRPTEILDSDNAQILHDRLAQLGAELLVETIPDYVAGKISPRPQPNEGVSHCGKIHKADGQLDWKLPARGLWNRQRAFTPWPGAFTHWQGKLLKIHQARVVKNSGSPGEVLRAEAGGIVVGCGENALEISELQLEGGKRLTAQQFLLGHQLTPGTVLEFKV
ncbi:MAG: hypothetical protein RLZZ350_1013 [Verrucomicrobiota bacterium]|jgi:methionyl-tRNA formyltransferase